MPGKSKLCSVCNKTRVSCGLPGVKPTHCGKCKLSGMTNLTILKCKVCKVTIPIYGIPGGKPTHCKDCKIEGMLDVKTRKCSKCKETQPVYGIKGSSTPLFCVKCKDVDMVDIVSPRCSKCNTKQPVFGYANDNNANFCGDCKLEGMIDLKSLKCIICKIKCPIYGLPGGKNTHCKDCKSDQHIDVKNHKCITCNKKQSTYGDPDTNTITHCKDCKPDHYIDLKHEICVYDYCDTRGQDKYRGYCAWCFQHLFPEDPLSRAIPVKTYEMAVAVKLLEYDLTYKHDTPIYIGDCDCSMRRRIDFWKQIGDTILAIEVDENQHKKYDICDEDARYNDLYMGFSGKWIFLRFNPNVFRDSRKRIVNIPLSQRIEILLKSVKEQEERIKLGENSEIIEIHKMFYDA